MSGVPFYRRPWFLRAAAILFFISVVILRDPRYFLNPRLWAEEGSLHFAFAYAHPGVLSLFQPQQGYLNFWPNLSTFAAARVPLNLSPLVTTLLALLVQLVPVVLILWSQSSHFGTWPAKAAGIAVYLFVPLSGEGWLNTINSYTFFAVITFLILLEPPPGSPHRRRWYRALLGLAGLSGALSGFLLPLFAATALLEAGGKRPFWIDLRSFWKQERWIQTGWLTLAVVIQAAAIFSVQTGANFGSRLHLIGIATLGVTLWTQSIALFSVGLSQTHAWARTMYSLAAQNVPTFQSTGRWLLFAGIALLGLLSARVPARQRFLFLGGYVLLLVPSMMFSIIQDKYALIDTGLHQRIFLPPNILLGWMLLVNTRFTRPVLSSKRAGSLSSLASGLLLAAAILWGAYTFFNPANRTTYWPDWKSEVTAWQADPTYALKIQPEGWVLHLNRP
jgi:hypothetical protein